MRYLLLVSICCLSANLTAAETSWRERLQIHGFASQAYIHTSDNQFFGDSKNGSFEFTELGINASFKLSPKLRLAGQVLSRQAGAFDNGSPRIDYALADITLFSNEYVTTGLYAGRVKNPIGLYNTTRDVAHTREGIFLPQAIYFDKIRNLITSSDGLHLYNNIYLADSTLIMQAGAGYPIAGKNVEYTYMGRDWDGDLDNNQLGIFGQLVYERNGGRWIYSLTGARASIDFNAKGRDLIPFPLGPGLTSGELEIDYTVLSAQYNGEKWQLTAEAAFENLNYVNISDSFAEQDNDTFGYFLQANYNFTPAWQAFLRYEEFQLNIHDWNGDKAAQKSLETSQILSLFGIHQPPSPAHLNYTKNWVIGGRWHINPQLMLRTEYHIVDGAATLSPRENNMPLTKRRWDMFAVSLSYRF